MISPVSLDKVPPVVNDGIGAELCSLRYASVDDAIQTILRMGTCTQLAKFAIESAYRIVPVHPTDRLLLGMQWEGQLYIDTALPFGLRSAPKIFNAVADGLQWILQTNGIDPILHYLDDFLLFGHPNSDQCKVVLSQAMQHCRDLGVPIAEHKTEGPSCCLTFLGIEIDTQAAMIRLPASKLSRLQEEIKWWKHTRSTTKRELLSLIGQLQHACCVVRPGRSFLRRMISLSTVAKELHHRIRLNKGFQSDLQWWAQFLPKWNGIGMMAAVVRSPPSATVTSDASGSWGCGAFSSSGKWFQLAWSDQWKGYHITVKELLPIVLSMGVWGHEWQGQTVLCRCDNAAVVAILRSGSSKDRTVMDLVRSLFFILAHFNIFLMSEHLLVGPVKSLETNFLYYPPPSLHASCQLCLVHNSP